MSLSLPCIRWYLGLHRSYHPNHRCNGTENKSSGLFSVYKHFISILVVKLDIRRQIWISSWISVSNFNLSTSTFCKFLTINCNVKLMHKTISYNIELSGWRTLMAEKQVKTAKSVKSRMKNPFPHHWKSTELVFVVSVHLCFHLEYICNEYSYLPICFVPVLHKWC
jgi:hypothetical protein